MCLPPGPAFVNNGGTIAVLLLSQTNRAVLLASPEVGRVCVMVCDGVKGGGREGVRVGVCDGEGRWEGMRVHGEASMQVFPSHTAVDQPP